MPCRTSGARGGGPETILLVTGGGGPADVSCLARLGEDGPALGPIGLKEAA